MIQETLDQNEDDKGDNEFDFIKQILFHKKQVLLKILIEKVTKVHLDFWSQLQEANPDLLKLNDTGNNINN